MIEGLADLKLKFQRRRQDASKDAQGSVIVGFTAAYALYVHENVEMKWRGKPRPKKLGGVYWGPAGQAKFLEAPARTLQDELGRIVGEVVKNGGTVLNGLVAAGLRLQREAQGLVPVVTGNLKNSAFTRKEYYPGYREVA